MAGQILLNGVSRAGRHEAISSATEALQRSGGWIDDVHFFSNVAVNVRCVILAADVPRLAEDLIGLPIGLRQEDTAALGRAASRLAGDEELTFSLQITFVHDEPDLRRHVPSVPG